MRATYIGYGCGRNVGLLSTEIVYYAIVFSLRERIDSAHQTKI